MRVSGSKPTSQGGTRDSASAPSPLPSSTCCWSEACSLSTTAIPPGTHTAFTAVREAASSNTRMVRESASGAQATPRSTSSTATTKSPVPASIPRVASETASGSAASIRLTSP